MFTHKHLVDIAYRWVLAKAGFGVAMKEMVASGSAECADVIGFNSSQSILIEVKVSRSDFLADRKKPFRKNPDTGMGTFRFYCCPENLIKVSELPAGWGLLYVDNKKKLSVALNPYFLYIGSPGIRNGHGGFIIKNKVKEYNIMYSALRRMQGMGYMKELYKPKPETNGIIT